MNDTTASSPDRDLELVPLQGQRDAWSRMSRLVEATPPLHPFNESSGHADAFDVQAENDQSDLANEHFEALADSSALPVTVYPFLRQASDRFAKALALDLRKTSGTLIDVVVVDQVNLRMGNAAAAIPVPSLMAIIQCDNSEAAVFVVVDGAMASLFFDLLLGGAQIRSILTPMVRNFSVIETRLFQIFSDALAASINLAFAPIFPLQSKTDRIETNPRFLPMGKAQDSVVKIRFLVQCGLRSGFVDLYLSARFLAPIEARLRPAMQKDVAVADPFWRKHLKDRLLQSQIELRANLCEFAIPLQQLRRLKKGDVLPLDKGPDSLIDLVIDKRVMARGRMGRSTGKIAIRIESNHIHHVQKDF